MDRSQSRFAPSLAVLLVALSATAHAQVEAPAEITVLGSREALPDVLRERSLDQDTIGSYGVSSLDDLIAEVRSELGDDEENEPIYFLNGQRVRNLTEISGLPLEALELVEALPTGAGARAGVSPNARVYNIILKKDVKSETAVVAPRIATDGGWSQVRGEGILTRLSGDKRLNISAKFRTEDSLRESERDILQLAPRRPYDLRGNIFADPRFAGDEIDPRLSALAGTRVTVAALPSFGNPALADFVRGANAPNITNLGNFRTFRPQTNVYEFSASHARSLASWLNASLSGRFNYTRNKSLTGLSSGLFVVTPDNAFSPFSQSVGLARYGDPLRQRYRRLDGSADFELKAAFGAWHANVHAAHQRTNTRSDTNRQDPIQAQQAIVLGSSVNPFSSDVLNLLSVGLDRSRFRTRGTTVEADIKGPPLRLPAGPINMGLDGRLTWTDLTSARTFFASDTAARLHRAEREVRGSLNVPLTSRANDVLASIGDLAVNFEYGRIAFSDAPVAVRYNYGLTWTPREGLRFSVSSYHARQTPGVETLGEPITFASGARVLDLLRGDTVDVTQITGGNPFLRAERFSNDRVAVNFRPIRKLNFNLNAEYVVTNRRDFISTLPRESVPIWLAFPERFTRDDTGRLATVDFRPANFELQHQERLRYGFGLNLPLGGGGSNTDQAERSDDAPNRPRPRWRLRLSGMHTVFLANRLDVRPGLAPVDLLSGGAIGIAGGRPQHQADFSIGLNRPGMGVRLNGVYRGANLLQIRGTAGGTDLLTFAPFTTLNFHAFVEPGTVFRETPWLKGARIGLFVANLTNARQRVTNGAGVTPLRYQPGYRDPLGRTIEIELRKQF